MQRSNEPFLKHLNVRRTPYVIATAEDEEFDEIFLQELRDEGFEVHYLAMGEDTGARFASRLHALADQITGISDRYAIVAFGDAASAVLEAHTQSTARLCAIIAYYPTTIQEPTRTHYPMDVSVLVHLAGSDVGVRKTPEMLGIQGKRKTVRRNVAKGMGLGGEVNLSFPTYSYQGVGPGFAEHDLDEYDGIAHGVAWSRTLRTLREGFGVKTDIEKIRDQHVEDVQRNPSQAVKQGHPQASVLCTPTLAGGYDTESLHTFYFETFQPRLEQLNARLISRTVGTDRVVDEVLLSFKHDKGIPWLLPNVPPTQKQVKIMLVSILSVKAGKVHQESLYWDQASILVQMGLLDPSLLPQKAKESGVGKLPVVGAEAVKKRLQGM